MQVVTDDRCYYYQIDVEYRAKRMCIFFSTLYTEESRVQFMPDCLSVFSYFITKFSCFFIAKFKIKLHFITT